MRIFFVFREVRAECRSVRASASDAAILESSCMKEAFIFTYTRISHTRRAARRGPLALSLSLINRGRSLRRASLSSRGSSAPVSFFLLSLSIIPLIHSSSISPQRARARSASRHRRASCLLLSSLLSSSFLLLTSRRRPPFAPRTWPSSCAAPPIYSSCRSRRQRRRCRPTPG